MYQGCSDARTHVGCGINKGSTWCALCASREAVDAIVTSVIGAEDLARLLIHRISASVRDGCPGCREVEPVLTGTTSRSSMSDVGARREAFSRVSRCPPWSERWFAQASRLRASLPAKAALEKADASVLRAMDQGVLTPAST